MNSTILTIPTTQDDREVLGPIARRIANNSPGAWLESHLQQYTDAVRALGNRGAAPHYLR